MLAGSAMGRKRDNARFEDATCDIPHATYPTQTHRFRAYSPVNEKTCHRFSRSTQSLFANKVQRTQSSKICAQSDAPIQTLLCPDCCNRKRVIGMSTQIAFSHPR
jgi:hypothetical protein